MDAFMFKSNKSYYYLKGYNDHITGKPYDPSSSETPIDFINEQELHDYYLGWQNARIEIAH